MSAERPDTDSLHDERARQKQASREEDDRALAAGETTALELERKNAFLRPARTVVRWDRAKPW